MIKLKGEAGHAGLFAAAGWLGFVTDYLVLRLALHLGLSPATGRIVSLLCAMHVTFLVNGLFVFRRLERRRLLRQWASYMAANGFGNFCNYWIFVTLVSLHGWFVSNHLTALAISGFVAWTINYTGTRLLVFRRGRAGEKGEETPPGPGEDGGWGRDRTADLRVMNPPL